MQKQDWLLVLGGLLWVLLFSHAIPVLDEADYWNLAEQLSWSQPYHWKMPWFPYEETGFVFAHPPLFLFWIKLFQNDLSFAMTQIWIGLPFLVLLFSSSIRLLRYYLDERYLSWAFGFWITSAGVLLPLTRTLMPDLAMTALVVFAMWRWVSGNSGKDWLIAGIALGFASWIKYPALIFFLVPVLDQKKGSFLFVMAGLGIFCLGEWWLWSIYDRIHLFEVLERAPEIARSSLFSRTVGIVNRLPVSMAGLALLSLWQRKNQASLGGFLGSMLCLFFAYQQAVAPLWLVVILGFIGGRFIGTIFSSHLLGYWSVLGLFSIIITHNYSAPRYWFVISIPITIQIFQNLSPQKKILFPLLGLSTLFSASVVWTEKEYAAETIKLASWVDQFYPNISFSGEWSFRWKMQELGHSFVAEASPPQIARAVNSTGWVDPTQYFLVDSIVSKNHFLTLSSRQQDTGYYADTLGYWPFFIMDTPLEKIEIWKKK